MTAGGETSLTKHLVITAEKEMQLQALRIVKEMWAHTLENLLGQVQKDQEHIDDAKKEKEDSHIHKHKLLEHPGEDVQFSMKVIRKHKSCFPRQVHEAILIEMAERDKLLNSKNSFNRCSIPRLSIENSERKVEPIEKDIPESEISEIFEKRKRVKLKQRCSNINFNCDPPTKRRKCMTRDSFSNDSVSNDEKDKNDLRTVNEVNKEHKQNGFPSLPSFPIFTSKENPIQKPTQSKRKYRKRELIPPKDYKFKSLSSHFVKSKRQHEDYPS